MQISVEHLLSVPTGVPIESGDIRQSMLGRLESRCENVFRGVTATTIQLQADVF